MIGIFLLRIGEQIGNNGALGVAHAVLDPSALIGLAAFITSLSAWSGRFAESPDNPLAVRPRTP